LTFSNFKSWAEKQDWQHKQLDKDILGDGKLYSKDTCRFVESWLNNILNNHGRATGKWPVGVSYDKSRNKFAAWLSIDGKTKGLGRFNTVPEAHQAYLIAKYQYVTGKINNYPDQKIREAVLDKLNDVLEVEI